MARLAEINENPESTRMGNKNNAGEDRGKMDASP